MGTLLAGSCVIPGRCMPGEMLSVRYEENEGCGDVTGRRRWRELGCALHASAAQPLAGALLSLFISADISHAPDGTHSTARAFVTSL